MEKVILEFRTTKEVKLPKSGVSVVVYNSLLAKDAFGIDVKEAQAGNVEIAAKLCSKLVKSWNAFATDKDEKPVEISEESLSLLPVEDLVFLVQEIGKFFTAEKKS